jgi:serine/threonine-protein kinase
VALDKELGREVALKEIQGRFAEDTVSRLRFVREAEFTGRLEHPGIVPVYSLGRRDDGQPFYAMRFIQGDNLKDAIGRYHAEPPADPGGRAVAFRQLVRHFVGVCYAVEYAHSRRVLHRDLKPANVMLGLFGEALVVDWGLAKPFDGAEGSGDGAGPDAAAPGGDSTLTLQGVPVGTPAFMSPEQAGEGRDPLGPASDVYSLGATLYYLLTGRAPFEGPELGEVLGRVRRGQFPPPRALRGDADSALSAVCLKAMATKPEDRYPSARALVEDIERWVADEPVSAWREPFPVRARRWARRHRTAVTSSAVALVVTAAALTVILAIQSWAKRNLEVANANVRSANKQLEQSLIRERAATASAESRFALALKAIQAYRDGVDQADVLRRSDLEPVRNKLLGSALTFYKDLSADLATDTNRRAARDEALLQAYFQLASLSDQIGSKTDAIQAYRQSVDLGRGLLQAGTTRRVRSRLGEVYHKLAIALEESGHADQALGAYGEAIAIRTGLVAEDPSNLPSRANLAGSYLSFGRFQSEIGRLKEALDALREAITRLERLTKEAPENLVYREHLAGALTNLGLLQMKTQDTTTSLATFRRAAWITEALHAEDPSKWVVRQTLARVYNNMGMLHRREGDTAAATTVYQKAITLQEALVRDDPARTELRRDLGTMRNNLGNLYSSTGRNEPAVAEFREAIRWQESLAREYPRVASYRQLLARSHMNLGIAQKGAKRLDDAAASYGLAINLLKDVVRTDPRSTAARLDLGRGLLNLGVDYIAMGQHARAVPPLREAISVLEALAHENPSVVTYRGDLANCLLTLGGALDDVGRPAEGEENCRRAIGLLDETVTGNPSDAQLRFTLGGALLNLGLIRQRRGDGPAALDAFRKSADHMRFAVARAPGVTFWRAAVIQTYRELAAELRSQKQVSEAAAAVSRCVDLAPSSPLDLYNAACDLALCVPLAEQAADARRYGDEAMIVLRRAAAAGWDHRAHAISDPNLKSLHSRRDFQEFVFNHGFPDNPFAH